jgi:branched-chain amino acid transport system ATP-binding protein
LCAGYEPDMPIIKSVTLAVDEGSFVSLIGPNGAGKSTLLKTVYGFLKPQVGKILYAGRDVTGWEPHDAKKAGIAYIPQELSHFPELSVEENLKLGYWVRRRENGLRQRLAWVYELFPNLMRKRSAKASTLSGGEAKMLDIGRGLMIKPRLLLVDEPSIGLSPAMAGEVYYILRKIKQEGITVLLVDQNIKRALEISDYTYVLDMGEIRHHGPSNEVWENIEGILQASLLGDLLKL